MDLEIRNGLAYLSAFTYSSSARNLNLTRLVVRNMRSTNSMAGAIFLSRGYGTISETTFINCTSYLGTASAVYLVDPDGWKLSNLSFIDCSYSEGIPATNLFIVSNSNSSIVTFGGQMLFKDVAEASPSYPSVFLKTQGPGNLSVLSDPSNPSVWKFECAHQNLVHLGSSAGPIEFNLGSITNFGRLPSLPSFMFSTSNYDQVVPITININGSVRAFGHGILLVGAPLTTLRARDDIVSTYATPGAALQLEYNATIISRNVYISDFASTGIQTSGVTARLRMFVENDLNFFRSSTGTSSLSAIWIHSGQHTIDVGNVFNITGLRSDANGGAILLETSGLLISSKNILFDSNKASSGGAVMIQSDGSLSMNATQEIIFRNNYATLYGGALVVSDTNSTISFPGTASILFENNTAEDKGGAAYFSPRHLMPSTTRPTGQIRPMKAVQFSFRIGANHSTLLAHLETTYNLQILMNWNVSTTIDCASQERQ
jgi:predicted outer membrane repeat protein